MKIRIIQCTYGGKNPINKAFSWLLRTVEKTEYSHYAIEVDGMVADATKSGVRNRSSYEFFMTEKMINMYTFDIDVTQEQYALWLNQYLGKPYGFLQLFSLLFRNLHIAMCDFGFGDKTIVCCELVLLLLRDLCKLKLGDLDNYDLPMTNDVLKSL